MRSFFLAAGLIAAGCSNGGATHTGTSGSTTSSTGTSMGGHGGAAPVPCTASPTAWSTVGATDTGKYAPAAIALDRSTLLFAGGWDATKLVQKTALTIAPDGTITGAGALSRARNFASVAPIAGGFLFTGGFSDTAGSVTTADIYDVASATMKATGSLAEARELFTTTALPDGRVVAIGGLSAVGLVVRSTAEVFDPTTAKWTKAGDLVDPRFGQAALYVPKTGRVLVGGGKTTGPQGDVFRGSLEWFDPTTGQFSHAGDLNEPRDRPTAALLPDGRVLFIGGANATSKTLVTTELFDPATGMVSPGPMLGTRRMAHAATVLGDGSIVVVGGWSDATTPSESTNTAERLDVTTMQWHPLPALMDHRHDLGLVTLGGCTVVAFGGLHATQGSPSTTPTSVERIDLAMP